MRKKKSNMSKKLFLLLVPVMLSIAAIGQTKTVTGTVTAENGEGIPFATVNVKNSSTGVSAGQDGSFSIVMPENGVLVVSAAGYETREVTPTGNFVAVSLVVSNSMDEVVVTALSVPKSQRAIGYSVSKVSGDELIRSGEANIVQGLAAKATGVQIVSSSGTPGASSKVILRGPATFSGDNQPLIVIDGVPIDNSVNNITAGDDPYNGNLYGVQLSNRAIDINPEDIASVVILKGPAAAALYGQSAGNGAIIYTTKRGRVGEGIGISLSSSVEFSEVNKLPELQSAYGQGANGEYTNATPNSWGPDLRSSGKPVFDNIDNFFRTGVSYNNNLSLSGGNANSSFRVSFGSSNIKGIVPESDMNRYTLRVTGDTKLNDHIDIGATVSYTNTSAQRVQNGSNLAGVMLPLTRMPVDFDGREYLNEDGTQKTYFASYDNPFYSVRYNPYNDETDRMLGNVYANVKLNDIFSVTGRVGSDMYATQGRQIYEISSRGNDLADGAGQINKTSVNFRNLYGDLLLNFNTSIGRSQLFSVKGLVGANYNYTQYREVFARGRNLALPGFYNLGNSKDRYVSDDESYYHSRALFVDATFDYNSIVFLTLTGRNEWSTTFGKGSKGFFYPKADLSYVFSSLIPNQGVISYGKVRVAYSNVGIAPDPYSDKTYFIQPLIADGFTNGFSFPYLGEIGYSIDQTLYGFGLKPERNVGLEAGLEMQFFRGRLGLDLTVYQQRSTDLLITQPVAPSGGFEYLYNNIGEIRNRGIELGLTGDIIKNENFNWTMVINLSKNNNEVMKLAPGVEELSVGSGFSDPQSFAIVGKPFGVFYGAKFLRDAEGNLLIDAASGLPLKEDVQNELGSPLPDWLGNINNVFSYKGVEFSFLWDIRKGGKIWNGTWQNLTFRGRTSETLAREQSFVIPGVYGNGPDEGKANTTELSGNSYFSNYLGGGGLTNELSIQDGGWVRLRSVELAYTFAFGRNNSNTAIKSLRLGVSGRNLLLFTDYKGVDPETSLTGSDQNFAGYDYFNNPGTRSYFFNLRATF